MLFFKISNIYRVLPQNISFTKRVLFNVVFFIFFIADRKNCCPLGGGNNTSSSAPSHVGQKSGRVLAGRTPSSGEGCLRASSLGARGKVSFLPFPARLRSLAPGHFLHHLQSRGLSISPRLFAIILFYFSLGTSSGFSQERFSAFKDPCHCIVFTCFPRSSPIARSLTIAVVPIEYVKSCCPRF